MPDSLRSLNLYRALVWVLVAVTALVIWGVSGPNLPSETDFDGAIRTAEVTYEANNSQTKGAPQQQVVNGWYMRDVLPVLAKQNSAIIEQQKAAIAGGRLLSTMLLVFGLGVCADVVGSSLLKNRKPLALAVGQTPVLSESSHLESLGAEDLAATRVSMSEPSTPPNTAPPTRPTWTPPQS